MPSPSFTFTIPSIHDNSTLQCRIFHPATPSDSVDATTPTCYTRAAIIAHPYAPQGGCYDDPIVESLVGTLLQRDYIVGTFNFRGAGSSNSHTSWTGRAETQDYVSLAGLLIHYLHSLQSLASPSSSQTPSSPSDPNGPITLILGGYSYGALIASLLPPPPAILLPFTRPSANTPTAEIRLRAEHLARERHLQENEVARRPRPASHSRGRGATDTLKPPIAIGGEESTPAPSSRTSRESSRKSGEGGVVRRSFETSRRKLRLGRHHHHHEGEEGGDSEKRVAASAAEDSHDDDDDVGEASAMNAWRAYLSGDTRTLSSTSSPAQVKTAYLLVSPPLPPVSHFLTGFSSFFAHRDGIGVGGAAGRSEGLVVYGDSDGFTSARKYRKWAAEVEGKGGSGFKFHEVDGAGHFYRERGALEGLLDAVGLWAEGVCFGQGELKA